MDQVQVLAILNADDDWVYQRLDDRGSCGDGVTVACYGYFNCARGFNAGVVGRINELWWEAEVFSIEFISNIFRYKR